MAAQRLPRLALIGLAAGVFSALFGVGGGSVMVPLLVWLGYDIRTATGTSLAAICIIALAAATDQGFYGNVHLDKAILIGVPAIAGVIFGTWLQQRIPTRAVTLMFAALMLIVAAKLMLG